MKILFRKWVYLMRTMKRFLLPWTACFSLFIGTSNCPCCGQPTCPKGIVGMGILAGIFAAITVFFKKGYISQSETN